MKTDGRRTKRILKAACADLLPAPILRRSKMGFGVPLGAWFRRQWRQPLQEYLDAPDSRLARYVRPERIRTLIQHHLSHTVDAGHQLWLFLTLEVWLRQLEQPRLDSRGDSSSTSPLRGQVPASSNAEVAS